MKRTLIVVVVALVLVWFATGMLAVDTTEYAYVTRFGQPVATYNGATDAGLHFTYPWLIDSVVRIDRRLQSFDLPATESLTRDPQSGTIDKTLTVDAYVTWQVPDAAAADRFVRSVGTAEQTKRVLAPRITSRLAALVSTLTLDELISVVDDAQTTQRADFLQSKLLDAEFQEQVAQQYGIEIISLRVRRLSYPEAVRTSIYERIRSERNRKVASYENEGRREAAEILSKAEQTRRTIEADARAKKQLIEGQAEVEADRLRNEAHSKDPEFYAFLQRLKSMQQILAESRDVLLLSLNHDLFKVLKAPQEPQRQPEQGK
jgi:membrane protease subunit HflC